MRINVFGAGRSGTKAVQLCLALALLRKHERIGLNYEPFLWQNHLIRHYSMQGIREHERLPLLMPADEASAAESLFVRQLAFYDHGVTKFINGNGRIAFITRLMLPDATAFVIRDLYDVLQSVMQRPWDFLGKGLPRRQDWPRLAREIRTKYPSIEVPLASSRQDRNAFFWYVSNKVAIGQLQTLASQGHLVRVLRFKKDMDTSPLLSAFGLMAPGLPMSQLQGGLIHTGTFYTPDTNRSMPGLFCGTLNDLLLRIGLRHGAPAPRPGLWVTRNERQEAVPPPGTKRGAAGRTPLARTALYDRWRDEVYADLAVLEEGLKQTAHRSPVHVEP